MKGIDNRAESLNPYSNSTTNRIILCETPTDTDDTGSSNGTTISTELSHGVDASSVSTTALYDTSIGPSLLGGLSSHQESVELNAAQDHANGISYFAVKIQGRKHLLTSTRQIIPFDELQKYGIKLMSEAVSLSGFSQQGIRNFLLGGPVAQPREAYKELLTYVGDYIVFREPEAYTMTVLYAIGTYFHCLFPSMGYLHFRGEMGSGKTRCCSVLSPVVFNGESTVSLRPEVLARSISTNRSTLLWDEAWGLGRSGINHNNTTFSILKSGICPDAHVQMPYRGAIVDYSTFGPKIFAGTSHLDPELEDRSIEIVTMKSLPDEHVARYVLDSSLKRRQQQLRDQLYALALTSGPAVAEMRNVCTEEVERFGLGDRMFDIYYPIFLIAMFLDTFSDVGRMEITDSVLAFVERAKELKHRRHVIDNVIVQLLTMVRNYLTENRIKPNSQNQVLIPTQDLFTYAKNCEYISTERTKSWLTRQLNDLGIYNHPETFRGKSRRVYEIDVVDFEDRCRRSLAPHP